MPAGPENAAGYILFDRSAAQSREDLMFRSIQTKTMFFLLTLAVCLVVIAGYMTVFAMDHAVDEIKQDDMRDKALTAAAAVSDDLAQAGKPDAAMLDFDGSSSISCSYFFVRADGTMVGCSDDEAPYDFDFSGKCSVQKIYKNEKYYMSALTPVNTSQSGWFLCAEEADSDFMKVVTNIKTSIIIGLIVIIFILWPIGKKISFEIKAPVRRLADDAERIAEGDISRGIQVSEGGELAEIAGSFNKMLNKLKDTMQQVLDKSAEAVSMQEIMAYVDETYSSLPTGVISINNIGEITTFNETAEEITGISHDDIIGISISNPTPPQIKKLISEMKRCLSRGSLQLKTITEISSLSGEKIPVEYSINILFGLKGEVIGAICVFRKIKDIHSFEESAERVKTMEALGEIAASMAHEIKNPLTSIRGNTQYLEMMLDEKGMTFDELDIIMHETDRLTNMLNRLLNYARPRSPETEKLHIENIMQYVVDLTSRDMSEGITVKCDFAETPCVMVDREMLESVFINMMLNAVQAMPEGGSIRLETTFDKNRNMVCASVGDTGKGIPPEISEKIFDPFFTTKDTGTGLGLPIALRTIKAHHGIIEVESIEGEMTKFTIMLPAVTEDEEEEQE